MDQLTAYSILGLASDASLDDVKTAYAELSKQYHPEEHPEEFQQIHEAYRTLTRGARNSRRSAPQKSIPKPSQSLVFSEPHKEELHFNQVLLKETEPEAKEIPSYDFERVLNDVIQKEQERIHELTLKATAEMETLLTPAYWYKLKLFEAFFEKPEYQDILKKPEFLQKLADMLADTDLKRAIYSYIIDYYRFGGVDFNDLIPEEKALYQVLKQKSGLKKKDLIYSVGIPAGILAGVCTVLKSFGGIIDTAYTLCFCIAIIFILLLLYVELYENHSSIFAQASIAFSLLIVQFIAVGIELYNVTAASLLFVAAGIWLIILGIVAIIKKMKRSFKKRD